MTKTVIVTGAVTALSGGAAFLAAQFGCTLPSGLNGAQVGTIIAGAVMAGVAALAHKTGEK